MGEEELPEGWATARGEDALDFARRPKGVADNVDEIAFLPMALISEDSLDVRGYEMRSPEKVGSGTYFEEGDILLARITPSFENGKIAIARNVPNGWGVATTEVYALRSRALTPEFLAHLLRSDEVRGPLKDAMEGATGRMRVPVHALEAAMFPIPPIKEQRRIVSALDAATGAASSAAEGLQLALRRAAELRWAVLQQEFGTSSPPEGEVDQEWTTLGEVAEWGSGGTPSKSRADYYDGEIPWAVSGDLNDGVVSQSSRNITEAGLAGSSAKLVDSGTVLIAMYGASIGRTGIAGRAMATNQAIAFAKPHDGVLDRDYLFWFLRSQKKAFKAAGKGGAQPNISQTVLKNWPVRVPSVSEQQESVARIEARLQEITIGTEASLVASNGVADLQRSILATAFRGELTERDPEDEPASKLLARIRGEREAANSKPKKRKRKSKRQVPTEV